jgi:hypothetical protein
MFDHKFDLGIYKNILTREGSGKRKPRSKKSKKKKKKNEAKRRELEGNKRARKSDSKWITESEARQKQALHCAQS